MVGRYRRKTGRRTATTACLLLLFFAGAYFAATRANLHPHRKIGDVVDSLNGVAIHHNGGVAGASGRNLAPDGYNIGIRYQCVEFVKRYYYQRFSHKMPNAYGHARDFFERGLPDGSFNIRRGLQQHRNGGASPPAPEDLIVFAPWIFNRYGHVAIVSAVSADAIEIVQQNPGPFGSSRKTYRLSSRHGAWRVEHRRILGWLRSKESSQ